MSSEYRKRIDGKGKAGFTLLEALLALSVNTLILFLMVGGLAVIQRSQAQLKETNFAQWHLFLNQFENELADEVLYQKTNTAIYTKALDTANTATYSYVLNKNIIVRQKSGEGYHPMLMNLKTVLYEVTDEGISIQTTFIEGKTFKAYLIMGKK